MNTKRFLIVIGFFAALIGCQCGPEVSNTSDGGRIDVGLPDAGRLDVAAPDADNNDAGTPEVVTPDAGLSEVSSRAPSLAWAQRVTGELTHVVAVVGAADGSVFAAGSFSAARF